MHGMDRTTGKKLQGIDHLKQSIADILTTPIGSRIHRRDYGSRLFELIDKPLNAETIAEIYMATAEAIERWEPRFSLSKAQVDTVSAGRVALTLEGEYKPTGESIKLGNIVL